MALESRSGLWPLMIALSALAVAAFVLWLVQPPRPPHVIVYLIDTLRADHLGCYGYERDTSPVIDAFSRDGVRFENAQAQSSWTKPSVGSLFTGLYPQQHGAERRADKLRSDVPVLAELLRARGYATTAVVSNPNVLPVFGFERGFDRFVDVESVARTARAEDVHRAVFEYLEQASDEPQFLYVHTRDPHAPYEPPPPYDQRFARGLKPGPGFGNRRQMALYDGEIAYGDQELARFLTELRDRGLFENAIIVVLSDHGEEFREHGGIQHGHTLYQEQLHVPLMVRFPKGRHAGRTIEQPVRIMDLMPTILEWLGHAPGSNGQSFAQLVTAPERSDYQPVLYARLDVDVHGVDSLIDGSHKLIHRTLPDAGSALFDLARDPAEKQDILASAPEVASGLRRSLERIVSRMRHGTYLELINARGGDRHRVSGSVTVSHGRVEGLRLTDMEAEDRVTLSQENARLDFDWTLQNRPNPIKQRPRVIVDVDRMHFGLSSPDAELTVELRVDGAPLPAAQVALGQQRSPELGVGPWRIRSHVPPVTVGSVDNMRFDPVGLPFLRVYTVERASTSEATIDEALDARLEALGYVETEP